MMEKQFNSVFDEGELDREFNTQKVRVDGVKQPVAFYNLDTIISVDYRDNSCLWTFRSRNDSKFPNCSNGRYAADWQHIKYFNLKRAVRNYE